MRLDPGVPEGAPHEVHDFAQPLVSLLSMLCTCVLSILHTYLTSTSLNLLTICDISYPHRSCRSSLPLITPRLDRLVVDAFSPIRIFLVFIVLFSISFSFLFFLIGCFLFSHLHPSGSFYFFADLPTTRPCNDLVISWVCFVLTVRSRPNRS